MNRHQPLRGAGGGGKGGGGSQTSYAPTEAADSLRSKAYARVIDLVSEGEIYGPVDATGRRLRNATLGTPVRNGSGAITSIPVTDGGAGYENGIYVSFTDDVTPTTACVAKTVVNGLGEITSLDISEPGLGYSAAARAAVVGAIGRAVNLDGVPLLDASWIPTFKDVTLEYRLGTQVQTPLESFPSGESTTNYGLEFKKSGPISFVVDSPDANKVIIGVMLPQLYRQLKDAEGGYPAGSILGTSAQYACYIRYTNENTEHAEELFFLETVTGKAASAYIRATEKDLPRDVGAERHRWYFRMERLSNDEVSVSILNKTKLEFVTVLTTEKLSFPLSAYFGIEVNAEQFRSIPVRSYDLKLLLVQVPSNYFPETRLYNRGVVSKEVTGITRDSTTATAVCTAHGFVTGQEVTIAGAAQSEYNGANAVVRIDADTFTYAVSGSPTTPATGTITAVNLITDPVLDGTTLQPASLDWDGSFYVAWTNNYAWCFYDLVMNRRYGTGEHAAGYYGGLDKWTTYLIGKICDEKVPDGYGGLEPRFTCNLFLQTPEDAFRVLVDMASGFRTMIYWANGQIVPVQDSEKTALSLFTNASVKDGMFTYAGTGKKARHTVALVRYNDARDNFNPKPEYVSDLEGILRYGVQPVELTAFGCTSRGQAYRHGLLTLMTERTNTETVTFRTGLEAGALRPGDVFKVNDRYRLGLQHSGRVTGYSDDFSRIYLDRPVTLLNEAYTAVFASPLAFFSPLTTTAADSNGAYSLEGATSEADAASLRTPQILERAVSSAVVSSDGNLAVNFLHPLKRSIAVTSAVSLEDVATLTAADHGLFSEQKVRLSGCDLEEFNGMFVVRVTSKDTFEIDLLSVPVADPVVSPAVAEAEELPTAEVCLVQPGAVWGLECLNAKSELYRLLNVELTEPGLYEVTGLEYHPEIYDAVDNLEDFDEEPPSSPQQSLLMPRAPAGLTAVQSPITSGYRVSLDWQAPEGSLTASYYVYVRQGLNNYSFHTEVHDTQADVDLTLSDDYSFRVVSVGPGGQTSQPAETEVFVGDSPTTAAYDRVTGLELNGAGYDSEFTSANAVFVWRQNSRLNCLPLGSENVIGASGGEGNALPGGTSFEVKVTRPETGATILPASGVHNIGGDTTFTFSFAANSASAGVSVTPNVQGPFRDFIFEVRLKQTVNGAIVYSRPERIRVSNPRPVLPQGIRTTTPGASIVLDFPASLRQLPDFSRFYVWVSTHPGFSPTNMTPLETDGGAPLTITQARDEEDELVSIEVGSSYYVRYSMADAFASGKMDTNISAQLKVDV